jgi:hypothetical protein
MRPRAGRGAWQVPQWQASGLEDQPAASIEERLRRPSTGHPPTREQMLDLARTGFAAAVGTLPSGSFRFLGGVKQHRHRVLYVWASELDCRSLGPASEPPDAAPLMRYVDLRAARQLIVPSQRRFLDELEILLRGKDGG